MDGGLPGHLKHVNRNARVKLKDIDKIIAGISSVGKKASIFRVARLWICALSNAPAALLTLSDVLMTGGIHKEVKQAHSPNRTCLLP